MSADKSGATRQRATSYSVAKEAGVSQSAVSRTFSPGRSVSEKTRKKVLAAARKLEYQPNAIARSLISKRSNVIGFVMADVVNPFYPAVLDLFLRKLQHLGHKGMLLMGPRDGDVDDLLPQLLEYQVDGLVITSASLSSTMAERCADMGTPVVLFNRYVRNTKASFVCCDNINAAREVANFLVSAGLKRLAYLRGSESTSTSRDRETGFTQRLEESGQARPMLLAGDYTYESGFAAALQLRTKQQMPDGIFCANDIMAMGVVDALKHELGLRVPEDVSVIGFDDIANARWPTYRLTTVRQPVERMVDRTIENLLQRSCDPELPQVTELLSGKLVVRNTVRTPS